MGSLMRRRSQLPEPKGLCRAYRMPWTSGRQMWYCVVSRELYWVVRYAPSGYAIGSAAGPFEAGDKASQVAELQEVTETLMKRRTKPGEGRPIPPHADYADLLETLPNLAAWMTDSTFDDGSPRLGGWMGLSCRAGSWVALLKDSGESLSLNVSAPTWTMLLALIEHSLIDPAAPWRADQAQGAQKSKGKK